MVGDDEVALGRQTLDRLGLSIGDHVELTGADGGVHEVTVVGRTLLPIRHLGEDVGVGEGALFHAAAAERFGAPPDPTMELIDLAPGTTAAELNADMVDEGLLPEGNNAFLGPELTSDLLSYSRVRATPLVLAGLLGLLGAGVLLHTVVTSTRRRRREMAVLKALGFRRRSVGAIVIWQSVALVCIALVVGMPAGIVAGRVLWRSFARDLGVVSDPVVPLLALAATAAFAILASVVLAGPPGQTAARRRPAADLATE